jgi:hexosaminidase
MKNLITFCFLLSFLTSATQDIHIIPQPAEVKPGKGFLTMKEPIGFIYNQGVPEEHGVSFFQDYLKKYYNITMFKSGTEHRYGLATAIFVEYKYNYSPKDGYEMTIDQKGIHIAGDAKGLFYAFQTLIQLLPVQDHQSKTSGSEIRIPFVAIKDYPRFPYRGMHLDVSRHFFPVEFVKKYIDYLALHKFNYFHWHLTEDQGWRIEIKKYPKLTETGAWRNGTIIGRYPGQGNDGIRYGGYYTQEQVKEIVKYAADRYITVIPEIEMPGHSSAAIAAYPELSCFPDEPTIRYFPKQCTWHGDSSGKQVQQTWGVFDDVYCAGKENTFQFIQNVLDEVLALFPSKYIHVGGDECPKENWKRCLHCQKRIRDENLRDEHELQSYFIQRVEKYLNSKGRILIGWDEILEGGLAPNAIVMSWRGEEGGIEAAKQNHEVIMTPGGWCYFDHSQSENEDSVTIGGFTPLEKVYSYEPVPKELEGEKARYVLGAQGNVWTEYMKYPGKVEYMIFPRMSALSEVLWTPKEKKNWNDFEKRLMAQFNRYELWKTNYSRAYFELKARVIPAADDNGVLWQVENKLNYPVTIKFNNSDSVWLYKKPQVINRSLTAYAYFDTDKQRIQVSQKFHFNKATGKKITLATPPARNYPGDGAFTLVNGIINEKGMARSREFLGFLGSDCEAVIDLGKPETIRQVKMHILSQVASWIWRPSYAEVFISADGVNYTSLGKTQEISTPTGKGVMEIQFNPVSTRYVKVMVKNRGDIPAGNPGAGNKAWLFVDEIEIE